MSLEPICSSKKRIVGLEIFQLQLLGNFVLKFTKEAVDKWIEDYNNNRPHQALAYKTPVEFYTGKLEVIRKVA